MFEWHTLRFDTAAVAEEPEMLPRGVPTAVLDRRVASAELVWSQTQQMEVVTSMSIIERRVH